MSTSSWITLGRIAQKWLNPPLWKWSSMTSFEVVPSSGNCFVCHSPSTISWLVASVKPCSFFSLILISPASFLWHLLSSRRLWPLDFSIFVLLSSWSSSPSLYHCTLMGWRPTKCTLKMALWPTFTVRASVNASRTSVQILGGSGRGKLRSF